MSLHFQLRRLPTVPLELEGITPCAFAGKSLAELQHAPIYHGNERCALGDFAEIDGNEVEGSWHFEGDWSAVHWLASGMTAGTIVVHGSVGRHCGCAMSGGQIDVHGDAGDGLAAEIKGGCVQVLGNAGHNVGSAREGSPRGMTGGMVLVHGDVGDEVGKSMRRGIIAVGGSCGDLLAVGMLAGTIFVTGAVGCRCAAAMRRGTLVLTHKDPPTLLPTIRHATRCQPLVVDLIDSHLRQAGFPMPDALPGAWFDMYHADLLTGGRGEIFVRT